MPPLFFGGSPAAAGPVAARHADVYLAWGEPQVKEKEKIDWIRSLAEREGRTVRFGVRLHTISRDSSAETWSTAYRLLGDLDAETIAAAQAVLGRSGYPHLEEAYWFGEGVIPELAARGLLERMPGAAGGSPLLVASGR